MIANTVTQRVCPQCRFFGREFGICEHPGSNTAFDHTLQNRHVNHCNRHVVTHHGGDRRRFLGNDQTVTLRVARQWDVVPGETVVVRPGKQWNYARNPYLSGVIKVRAARPSSAIISERSSSVKGSLRRAQQRRALDGPRAVPDNTPEKRERLTPNCAPGRGALRRHFGTLFRRHRQARPGRTGSGPAPTGERGIWAPSEHYWGEEDEPIEEWAKPIIARGPQPEFEMEQVLPGADSDDPFSDPITESNDRKDSGPTWKAFAKYWTASGAYSHVTFVGLVV
jgi:hypothetical protein